MTISAFICFPALSQVRIHFLPNDSIILNLITCICFLCQMKESIMNQEKLAKLQAQVRIGGKVSWSACWQIYSSSVSLELICHSSLLCSVGVSPQKEEGGAQNGHSR